MNARISDYLFLSHTKTFPIFFPSLASMLRGEKTSAESSLPARLLALQYIIIFRCEPSRMHKHKVTSSERILKIAFFGNPCVTCFPHKLVWQDLSTPAALKSFHMIIPRIPDSPKPDHKESETHIANILAKLQALNQSRKSSRKCFFIWKSNHPANFL